MQSQDQQRHSGEHRTENDPAGTEDAAEELLHQSPGAQRLLCLADQLEAVVEGFDPGIVQDVLKHAGSGGGQVCDLFRDNRDNRDAR